MITFIGQQVFGKRKLIPEAHWVVPSFFGQIVFQAAYAWVQSEKIELPATYGVEEITYALWAQIQGMAMLRANQLQDFDADFEQINRLTLEIFLEGFQQWKKT